MHDLLIRGGLVVDGTGLPGRPADIAVSGGRVTAIGRLAGDAAQRTIDADGLVVAPGIVDAHTHYDPQITWDPVCDTSALHGVTTVAAGNCGFSVAPCRADDHDYLAQLFARVEGMELRALSHVGWTFEVADLRNEYGGRDEVRLEPAPLFPVARETRPTQYTRTLNPSAFRAKPALPRQPCR